MVAGSFYLERLLETTQRWLCCVVCLGLIVGSAWAEDLKFYTTIKPSSGTLDDQFIYSVVIEGKNDSAYPFLSGGDDFKLSLIGPQSSINIVNGQVSAKIIYTYRLFPKKSGILETPAAEISVDNKKYTAEPLKVEVKPADTNHPSNSSDPVFVRQTVESNSVYLGEQVVNSVELYTSAQLVQPEYDGLGADGFWAEDLGETQNLTRYLNGKQYDLILIRKALFPLKPGKLHIPERHLKAQVRVKQQRPSFGFPGGALDPFGDSFFDDFLGRASFKDLELNSNALDLEVKELPGAPGNFPDWGLSSALVGDVQAELHYDSAAIKSGESKTIELVVTGTANLNPLKKVPLNSNSRMKIYQETPQITKRDLAGKLNYSKVLRFSLIPLTGGHFHLDGLQLGYFDPKDQRYKIAKTSQIDFEVSGDLAPEPSAQAEPRKELPAAEASPSPALTIKPPSEALPAYQEETRIERLSRTISKESLILGALFLALLVCFALSIYWLMRSQRPARELLKKIQAAANLSELESAFRLGLFRKQAVSLSLSGEELRQAIKNCPIPAEIQYEIGLLLEEITYSLFSPNKDAKNLSELKARALAIIRSL